MYVFNIHCYSNIHSTVFLTFSFVFVFHYFVCWYHLLVNNIRSTINTYSIKSSGLSSVCCHPIQHVKHRLKTKKEQSETFLFVLQLFVKCKLPRIVLNVKLCEKHSNYVSRRRLAKRCATQTAYFTS